MKLKADNIVLKKPMVTIITVVYNAVGFLEETINSVLTQSYEDFEYIIIDGGSRDGTLDIIKNYANSINVWLSESDKGIYDAMNKGLALASGRWVIFMNAGDCFFNSVVLEKLEVEFQNPNRILVGDVKYRSGKTFKSLSCSALFKNPIHHQAAFYPLMAFKKLGFYSEDYRLLSDYHFNLLCMKNGFIFTHVDSVVAVCLEGGVSDTPKWVNYKEEIKIRGEFMGFSPRYIFFTAYSILRFFTKRLLRWI